MPKQPTCSIALLLLLLAFGRGSDRNVADALCSYTYGGEQFAPGSGLFTSESASCVTTSDTMGLWAEQVGGVQDEFSVYVEGLKELTKLKFYGTGDHSNFRILDVPEEVAEFYVVVWCDIGINKTGNCAFERTNWTIADCQPCPSGSVRQYGECSLDTPPTDTVCLVDCPPGPGSSFSASDGGSTLCQLCRPGSFKDVSDQTECVQCPAGTFSSAFGMTGCEPCPLGTSGSNDGEWRATCSGPCPARTYGSTEGLTQCTDCPYQSLAPTTAPEPIGLTSVDECSDFQTAGFWLPAGSGSLAGGGSWTTSLSRGIVDLNRTSDEIDALKQEVASALLNGTYFEANSTGEWAIKAGSRKTIGFSPAAVYIEDISTTDRVFFSYKVSESVRNSLSAAVASSIMEYSDNGCELECPQLSGNPAMTAYGWRWIQLIFEYTQDEVVMAVETCETQCLYQPDAFPQCPPGRCDDDNCAVCVAGSFAEPEIDKIASSSTTPPTPGGSEGISTGAVVGIALGGVAIAVVVVMASFRWGRKRGNGILYNDTPLVAEPVSLPISSRTPSSLTPEPSTIIAHVLPFSDGDSEFNGEVREDINARTALASKDVGPQYKDQVREADRAGAAQIAHSSTPQYKDQVREADRTGTQGVHSSSPQYKDQVREADRPGAAQVAHSSSPQYKDQVREADRAGAAQVVHSSSPQYKQEGSSAQS